MHLQCWGCNSVEEMMEGENAAGVVMGGLGEDVLSGAGQTQAAMSYLL